MAFSSTNRSPSSPRDTKIGDMKRKQNPVTKILRNGISRPPHHGMSAGEYLSSRLRSLKPGASLRRPPNPVPLLRSLTARQWSFFLVAFFAWTWDSFDFFTVSLTIRQLATEFGRSPADITWGITLVLMFRSVGSVVFGLFSDRYGRKWPFIVNNILFIALELATGFCNTYQQFLACRALFGMAMGGLYGNAAATALEDCPEEARGIMSGILQQGYALGYLLCAAFSRALVNTTPHGWRPLFWFGACPPVLFIVWRLLLPENDVYQEHQLLRDKSLVRDDSSEMGVGGGGSPGRTFVKQGKLALKKHWLVLTYLVLLMAGFNFLSHGSQDLYPLLLEDQLQFSPDLVTITQVVANVGAILGGTVVGYSSQIVGRRLSIIACCVAGGALLYPYTFSSSKAIIAAAFFEQFCVQGAWGVVPVHLMELSPGAFRTFVVGTSYQLGNLASSASSTIEARLSESFPLPPGEDGRERYDYGRVMCIFIGCVYAYLLVLTILGPEHAGRKFGIEHDAEVHETFGHEIITRVVSQRDDDTRDGTLGRLEAARRVRTV